MPPDKRLVYLRSPATRTIGRLAGPNGIRFWALCADTTPPSARRRGRLRALGSLLRGERRRLVLAHERLAPLSARLSSGALEPRPFVLPRGRRGGRGRLSAPRGDPEPRA